MSTSSLRRNRSQQQAEKNVFRLKNSMPDKFQEVIMKHLSTVTDLQIEDLEAQITKKSPEKVASKRRSAMLFYKKSFSKKKDQTKLTPETVDSLKTLIDFIGKSTNITNEGLFRKTGNINRQKNLRKQLLENADIDLENISSHDGANVLKNFIRDLPEPLLTTQFRNVYLHLATTLTTKEKSKTSTLKALQLLNVLLPGINYCLLRPLLTLLQRTARFPENLMNAEALALMFTPHFLCSKSSTGNDLQETTNTFSALVAFMIENGNHMFRIPQDLADEVSNFWKEMEIPNHLYYQNTTKKNRPLKSLDDNFLIESPAKTPKKKSRRSLVHVIDLGISPDKRRLNGVFSPRQRQSSESSDGSLPEKRPVPELIIPQIEASNNSTNKEFEPVQWNFPPSCVKDKPVAMVKPFTRSPISQFFRNVPQKVMQTPRSRAPMAHESPMYAEKDILDSEEEIMV